MCSAHTVALEILFSYDVVDAHIFVSRVEEVVDAVLPIKVTFRSNDTSYDSPQVVTDFQTTIIIIKSSATVVLFKSLLGPCCWI